MKTLIVEDMATYRSIISRSLSQIEGVEVVGKVSNGKKALEFLDENEVDLITLDVEMPVMDGLATLNELRNRRIDVNVIMLSGLSDQAANLTIRCLELGAIDFVLKPQSSSFAKNQTELVESLAKIINNTKPRSRFTRKPTLGKTPLAASGSGISTRPIPKRTFPPHPTSPTVTPAAGTATPAFRRISKAALKTKIVMIGVSTGGPKALSHVWASLKGPLPFPIIITQHMPPKFTKSLAESLTRKGTVPVVEAQDGDVIQSGTAYLAPGGYHLTLEKDDDFGFVAALTQDPPVNSCRPSVDVMMRSTVNHFRPGEMVAIIMTGMGRDGADGCVDVNKAGGYVVSQSADSCTIYGMPKAVEEMGLQDEILDLDQIAPFIDSLAKMGNLFRKLT